jgi:hypothetical protein
MMKHTNEDVRKAIAKHLLDNPDETYKSIARRINCSPSTIYNIAKAYEIRRLPRLGIERIVRLGVKMPTCKQCGDVFVPVFDGAIWCQKCNDDSLKKAGVK